MKKVLILFGGDSNEHYVSCKSARTILENIDKSKYEVTSAGIKEDWYVFNDNYDFLTNGNWLDSNIEKITNIIEFIKGFDVVFPIIHGNTCEDGKIQSMLELFKIKYVGCNPCSNLLCYDKELTKIILNNYNIPQVDYVCISKDYNMKEIIKKIEFPMIIKPCKSGSSIGINKATNKKELKIFINEALKYDNKIIVEKFINAKELECAIRGTDKLVISDIGEIKTNSDFYDYEAKYNDSSSKTIIPADIPHNVKIQIQALAKKVFNFLRCRGMARIDFFYNDKIYLNEINTIPGFTDISMYPMLLTNKNFSCKDLITYLIESAFN